MQPLDDSDPLEIGDYRLMGRLGAGGMGLVYLGQSLSNRLVAVKVVHRELAADAEFRDRFSREISAVRQVSGAFTAPVVDADPQAATPWLATVYIPGPTLDQAVEEHGPLPENTVRTLGAGLSEALRDIHRSGLIHRDLKPGNVLLAEDGPRVLDFGIAHLADGTKLTKTGTAIGTPGFWSPEQVQQQELTSASDVFSLGALLGFAAQGRPVFGTGHPLTQMRRVCDGDPDLADVPDRLRELLDRCLAKPPEQRPKIPELLRMASAVPTQQAWLPDGVTAMVTAQTKQEGDAATEITPPDPPTRKYTEFAANDHPAPPPREERARSAASGPPSDPKPAQNADTELAFARGQDFERAGQSTTAMVEYEEAARAGHPDAAYRLGALHAEREQTDAARSWLKTAFDLGVANAGFQLGYLAEINEDEAGAEKWYRKAIAQGDVDSMVNLGVRLRARGNDAEAEVWYRRAANSGDQDGKRNLARLAQQLGRLTEATTLSRELAEAGDVASMGDYADLLVEHLDDPVAAEEWFRKAVDGGSTGDAIGYGNLLYHARRFSEAEHWYRHAADHGHVAALNNLALALVELGRVTEAEHAFRKAVDAGDLGSNVGYGNLLIRAGRNNEAEHWLRPAVDEGPDARNSLGNALSNLGRVQEAEEEYRKAGLDGDTNAMYNLGVMLAGQERYADARHWFVRARDGGDPDAADRLRELVSQRWATPPPTASPLEEVLPIAEPESTPSTTEVNTWGQDFGYTAGGIGLIGLVPVVQIPVGWAGSALWSWVSGSIVFLQTWHFSGLFSVDGFLQVLGLGYFLVNVIVLGLGAIAMIFTSAKDADEWGALVGTLTVSVLTFLILRGVGWL